MSIIEDKKKPEKIIYLANAKIFLTILVILHHIAIAYGGAGDWIYIEGATDEISPILLMLFNIVNQSYFMAFFFMISSYFMVPSYEKKGAKLFLKDRLIRLGIPILIFCLFLVMIIDYFMYDVLPGNNYGFGEIFIYRWTEIFVNGTIIIGPLWFLETLLLFSIGYVIYRIITDRKSNPTEPKAAKPKIPLPDTKQILMMAVIMGLLTFCVRLVFPEGSSVGHFQLCYYVQYIFAFIIGVYAYRNDWFNQIGEKEQKLWTNVEIGAIILVPILWFAGGALENSEPFLGGFTWQSMVFSIWQQISCFAMIIILTSLFHRKWNITTKNNQALAANVYTMYILHPVLIVGVSILLVPLVIPSFLKMILVAFIVIGSAWILSALIRKIPYADRVLG